MSRDDEKTRREKERERAVERERARKERHRAEWEAQQKLEKQIKKSLQPLVVERNRPLREAYRAWSNQLRPLIEFLRSRGIDDVTIEKLIYPLLLTRENEIREIKQQIRSEESE